MSGYRKALITGASSGIGRAFAMALPPTTDLLLNGRDADRLAETSAALASSGRIVETVAADLTTESGLDEVVGRAEAFGIDLLINNAGSGRLGPFLDGEPSEERETVLLNVVAVVDLSRRLLPGMLDRARAAGRRAGLIIVSSTTAFVPVPFFATYAASKTFDLHFAEALGDELRGQPIDVLALCPGATRTGFGRRSGTDAGAVPGASDPVEVASQALAALGRQRVVVTGRLDQAALGPLVLPRRLVTGAVGLAMRVVSGRTSEGRARRC